MEEGGISNSSVSQQEQIQRSIHCWEFHERLNGSQDSELKFKMGQKNTAVIEQFLYKQNIESHKINSIDIQFQKMIYHLREKNKNNFKSNSRYYQFENRFHRSNILKNLTKLNFQCLYEINFHNSKATIICKCKNQKTNEIVYLISADDYYCAYNLWNDAFKNDSNSRRYILLLYRDISYQYNEFTQNFVQIMSSVIKSSTKGSKLKINTPTKVEKNLQNFKRISISKNYKRFINIDTQIINLVQIDDGIVGDRTDHGNLMDTYLKFYYSTRRPFMKDLQPYMFSKFKNDNQLLKFVGLMDNVITIDPNYQTYQGQEDLVFYTKSRIAVQNFKVSLNFHQNDLEPICRNLSYIPKNVKYIGNIFYVQESRFINSWQEDRKTELSGSIKQQQQDQRFRLADNLTVEKPLDMKDFPKKLQSPFLKQCYQISKIDYRNLLNDFGLCRIYTKRYYNKTIKYEKCNIKQYVDKWPTLSDLKKQEFIQEVQTSIRYLGLHPQLIKIEDENWSILERTKHINVEAFIIARVIIDQRYRRQNTLFQELNRIFDDSISSDS